MASDSQDKPPLPSYVEISEETRRLIALPLRCETIDGESFISLAMRLAARNGLSGPRELWSSFGLLEWNDTALMRDPLDVVTMSLVSGETHERIASLSPVWVERTGNFREWDPGSYFAQLSGQSLEFRDFAQTRRVCPACIAESPHEPLLWRVDALAGCLKHGTLFITACICGRKLDWSGHVNVCPDCGVQLGSLASDPMPAADVDVTEYVMGRFLGEKDAPCAWLNGRTLGQTLAMIRWVGDVAEAGNPDTPLRTYYASGFAALRSPPDELLSLIRARGGNLVHVGNDAAFASARVGAGYLQPSLPGLVPEIAEPIAALVRVAAASDKRSSD
jgi:hypothetical protein